MSAEGSPVEGENGDIGNHVRVKVLKNKGAPPLRAAEFDIIFGKGICKIGNILDVAVDLDIVKKAGAWFSYNDEKLGQGREKTKDLLELVDLAYSEFYLRINFTEIFLLTISIIRSFSSSPLSFTDNAD